MVHQEDAPPATANHAEGGTKKEPTGVVRFFDHFTTAVRETGILDSGAMGNFLKNGVRIPTERPSGKPVGIPNGSCKTATQQVLLPTTKLNEEARVGDKLSGLQINMISVPILAANSYTTIFD